MLSSLEMAAQTLGGYHVAATGSKKMMKYSNGQSGICVLS